MSQPSRPGLWNSGDSSSQGAGDAIGPHARRLYAESRSSVELEPLLIRTYRPVPPAPGTLCLGGPQPIRQPSHPLTPVVVREAYELAQRDAIRAADGRQGGWEGYCVVMWADRRAGLVGITDRDGELVREAAAIGRLDLWTGIPARGPGWVAVLAHAEEIEHWIEHQGPEPALAEWLRKTLPEIHPHAEETQPCSDV